MPLWTSILTLAALTAFQCEAVEWQGAAFETPFFTGRIQPTPQQVEYFDESIPLSKVGIELGEGVASDDPRLPILFDRLKRHGAVAEIAPIQADGFSSYIRLGVSSGTNVVPDRAPMKPESYVIRAVERDGKPVMILEGGDCLGLLWAITAFNQMVTTKDGKPVWRKTHLTDFPDTPGKRAYTAMNAGLDYTWYAVQCLRPNIVVYRMARQMRRTPPDFWRGESSLEAWKGKIRQAGEFLNPLGIEWYDSVQPVISTADGGKQIRSKSEEDFQAVFKMADFAAEQGGNFCLLYDDMRFPLSPEDKRDFGTARAADVYFLNKLFAAVKARHPHFKLLFCPPFYWGPESDVSDAYGESRDEYLAAMGTLPEGIEFYWTGPKVKSTTEEPKDVQWITGLVKRKPEFHQNSCGVSHGGIFYHYDTEPIKAWPNWYDASFFDALSSYTFNSPDLMTNTTLFDYLWNRAAYAPLKSIEEAGRKAVGPKAYPKLVEFYKALESMDDYGWSPNAKAAKGVEDVKHGTEELQRIYDALEAANPCPVKTWTRAGYFIAMRQAYLKKLLAMPNLKVLGEADDKVRADAVKETKADPATDIILTAGDFRAKRPTRYYKWKDSGERFIIYINGARTDGFDTMEATFSMGGQPPNGSYELAVCALDHNAKPPCRIRILLNDNVVFEGENPFESERFTVHAFKIPARFLSPLDNRLVINNLEDSDNISGAPFFMLNYAVMRKAKSE